MRPKHNGTNIMVSDFVVEDIGGFVSAHRALLQTGPGKYWNNERLMEQVKKVEEYLTAYYSDRYAGNEFTDPLALVYWHSDIVYQTSVYIANRLHSVTLR